MSSERKDDEGCPQPAVPTLPLIGEFWELFTITPVPIVVLWGCDLVVCAANPAYTRAVLDDRDVQGQPLLEAIPELVDQGYDVLLQEVLRTGRPYVGHECRVRLRRRDGRVEDTYWTFAYAPLRDDAGRVAGVVAICDDVTEQVKTRKRLQELAREAETANRTKDEFLAMLGHELRNPLSPIVTALQLLRLRGVRSREQEIIERQVGHLTRLVDDLLDVSRITRGKVELRRVRLELAEAVQRALETASPLLEQRRQRVDVRVPRSGLAVQADPDRLAQVFSNLLTNAAKYSGPGSSIVVEATRSGEEVAVRVKDPGMGLTPDMLDRIFEPFVQHAQALDRAGGGLGLGLAIARSLVELHGGRISARSDGPGKGSEFTVELPAATHEGAPTSPRTAEGPLPRRGARGTRVLVVEDNEDVAITLKHALEELGYEVDVALSGPGALERARAFKPDVALVDIGLPVMDGYEVAQRLRELRGARDAPHLVAVTGYGQEADRRRSAAAGFEEHLVKPVDLPVLDRVVQRLHG